MKVIVKIFFREKIGNANGAVIMDVAHREKCGKKLCENGNESRAEKDDAMG